MTTYFIVVSGTETKVYLDQVLAADGHFGVAKGFNSDKCECGRDISETGTLYGIPGEEGGASVLCDELNGGCEEHYPVQSMEAIVFPPVLVTGPEMSDEMMHHLRRQAEGRVRRGSAPLLIVELDLTKKK